jgi:hypothetical protein
VVATPHQRRIDPCDNDIIRYLRRKASLQSGGAHLVIKPGRVTGIGSQLWHNSCPLFGIFWPTRHRATSKRRLLRPLSRFTFSFNNTESNSVSPTYHLHAAVSLNDTLVFYVTMLRATLYAAALYSLFFVPATSHAATSTLVGTTGNSCTPSVTTITAAGDVTIICQTATALDSPTLSVASTQASSVSLNLSCPAIYSDYLVQQISPTVATIVGARTPATSQLNIPGLSPNTQYQFRLTCGNATTSQAATVQATTKVQTQSGCVAPPGLSTNPGVVSGHVLWDSPGSYDRFVVPPGTIASYPFTPSRAFQLRTLSVDVNTEPTAFAYKDVSISTCAGDFSATVPPACRFSAKSLSAIYTSSSASAFACVLDLGVTYYINIKASNPTKETAYDMGWN